MRVVDVSIAHTALVVAFESTHTHTPRLTSQPPGKLLLASSTVATQSGVGKPTDSSCGTLWLAGTHAYLPTTVSAGACFNVTSTPRPYSRQLLSWRGVKYCLLGHCNPWYYLILVQNDLHRCSLTWTLIHMAPRPL